LDEHECLGGLSSTQIDATVSSSIVRAFVAFANYACPKALKSFNKNSKTVAQGNSQGPRQEPKKILTFSVDLSDKVAIRKFLKSYPADQVAVLPIPWLKSAFEIVDIFHPHVGFSLSITVYQHAI
jgi:hypothetical protein